MISDASRQQYLPARQQTLSAQSIRATARTFGRDDNILSYIAILTSTL